MSQLRNTLGNRRLIPQLPGTQTVLLLWMVAIAFLPFWDKKVERH
jgi:hypothetical protein